MAIKVSLTVGDSGSAPDSCVEVTIRLPVVNEASMISTPEQIERAKLRQVLSTLFNESELSSLCFDLSVNYENLPGNGTSDKARELIAHLDRRGRISELVDSIRMLRPQVVWEDIPQVTEEAQQGGMFHHVCP